MTTLNGDRERSYEIDWTDSLRRRIRTVRDEWLYDGFRGLEGAREALGVSKQAVHRLYTQGIRNREVAIKIHEALVARKKGIPIAELLEIPGVEWCGPERHGGGNGNGRRKPVSRQENLCPECGRGEVGSCQCFTAAQRVSLVREQMHGSQRANG